MSTSSINLAKFPSPPNHHSQSINWLAAPVERKNIGGLLLLWCLLLTTLVDANQIAMMTLGADAALSPLMLAICVAMFFCFQFRFRRALGQAGQWYSFCFLVYLLLGALVRFEFSDYAIYETYSNLRLYVPSLIITLAVALGARHATLVLGPGRFMTRVFAILLLHVVGILLGIVAGDILYARRTQAAVSASKAVTGREVTHDTGGRQLGFFGNPNETGMAMAMLGTVAFGCLVAVKKGRGWFVLGIVAAAACCVSTFSRSALIAFVGATIIQALVSDVYRRGVFLFAGTVTVAGIVWFVAAGADKMQGMTRDQEQRVQSFRQILQGEITEKNTGSRLVVAARGIGYWLEKPLFGHGIGAAKFMPTKSVTLSVGPHNQFIAMLVDCGIPGLLLFSGFLLVAFHQVWTCPVSSIRVFGLGYLGLYLCNALTAHTLLSSNTYAAMLGILFGAVSAARTIARADYLRRAPVALAAS